MHKGVSTALFLGLPAIYKLLKFSEAPRHSYVELVIPVIMLIISVGLLFRKKWGYHSARVILWIILVVSVLGIFIVPNLGTTYGDMNTPRAVGLAVLSLLISGWLLYQLETDKAKKDFGLE